MSKAMEMIERLRGGEDARKVIRGFLREGKGGESDAEGLDERTERFLRESKRRKNRRV